MIEKIVSSVGSFLSKKGGVYLFVGLVVFLGVLLFNTWRLEGRVDTLSTEKATLELAAATNESTIATLRADIEKLRAGEARRQAEYEAIARDYQATERRLAHALDQLSESDRQCATAPVPCGLLWDDDPCRDGDGGAQAVR